MGKVNFSTTKEQLKEIVDDNYALKYYFSEYPMGFRKKILKNAIVLSELKKVSVQDVLYEIRKDLDREIKENMPYLIDSIVLNTLAYEANERLEKTTYRDYSNPAISKHAKPFINGQYQIFRNDYENIFFKSEEETQKVMDDTSRIVSLIRETGMQSLLDIEHILQAHKINPKSINGIANKILKTNN